MLLPFVCLIVFNFHFAKAVTGVDVSSAITQWPCLKGRGVEFVVARGWESVNRPDPNVINTLQRAKAAGIAHLDVYLFPCVPCGNPAAQAQGLVNHLRGHPYGMIWLDIETYAWSHDHASNQRFISGLINELKSLGQHIGIYTNLNNWANIVGVGWNGAHEYPLWYAHYDGQPNFNDFRPFGGWSRPNIKQYAGDVKVCSSDVDMNWHP